MHMLIMVDDDALDLAAVKNSSLTSGQQVQSWSSSLAISEVCSRITGSPEDSQPIAHWRMRESSPRTASTHVRPDSGQQMRQLVLLDAHVLLLRLISGCDLVGLAC